MKRRSKLAKKLRRGKRSKPRLPPGSPPGIVESDKLSPATLRMISYNATDVTETTITGVEDVEWNLDNPHITWIDVVGINDPSALKAIGRKFDLHPLALEDTVNIPQRAKLDVYQSHAYFVLQMVHPKDRTTEQISLFLGKNFVVTVQQRPGDCLDGVRERIRKKARLRSMQADYLAYAIIDAVIDTYFPLLESMGDEMDQLEEALLTGTQEIKTTRIHEIKSDLSYLQRLCWGHRDFLRTMVRGASQTVTEDTILYFRDCLDHTLQQLDLIDAYRDTTSSLMDLIFATANHETNQVVKILTIVTSIFIPLSFVAGVYGMNFDPSKPGNMPETQIAYGYPIVLGVMTAIALCLLGFFRHKRWI